MIALTLTLMGMAALLATVLCVRRSIRNLRQREYAAGRAEHKHDVCSFLAIYAQAKAEEGDQHTASTLRAAGAYIWNDLLIHDSDALKNETRAKLARGKDLEHGL